jgi:hypothetical protein
LICVVLALSGKFVLIGTQSSWPLVAIGAGVAGYGAFRIYRERKRR